MGRAEPGTGAVSCRLSGDSVGNRKLFLWTKRRGKEPDRLQRTDCSSGPTDGAGSSQRFYRLDHFGISRPSLQRFTGPVRESDAPKEKKR